MEIFPRRRPKILRFQSFNMEKVSNACQVMNSRHGSMVQGSQKMISLPVWKKFDTLDIKLYDRAFRIFHWIHSFFQCSTFTCQQKFCHFGSGNIFQNNSVENCFAIAIFYHNISTDSIDVITGYMTLLVSLVAIFERSGPVKKGDSVGEVTVLVTSLCWWLYDGDWLEMLLAESLCWRFFFVLLMIFFIYRY